MANIESVQMLLSKDLSIPKYQRPYKWTIQSVDNLLSDIQDAIAESYQYIDFKYRIGTVILHGHDVVDGQQRLMTLSLINLYLDAKFSNSFIKKTYESKITQKNIHENYLYIKEWFAGKTEEEKESFRDAMDALLEIVVIYVDDLSEAFQVFDSQNYRGKSLEPHDLLKAFHLREMQLSLDRQSKDYAEMETVVRDWEDRSSETVKKLFSQFLFPIYNWCRCNKTTKFTTRKIDVFKGVNEDSPYYYAKYVQHAMPNFQLTEPIVAGQFFFKMVSYYLAMLECIKNRVRNREQFPIIADLLAEDKEIEGIDKKSIGYKYACNLFYCALLCYYDRFGNFNEFAIRKIFVWAFMLRIDMDHLGYDSVNKYAVGGENNHRYTNHVALFSEIAIARLERDVLKIKISVWRSDDCAENDNWNKMYQYLKDISAK